MPTTFILDTNVLLHDARSIFKFDDGVVILPITVIEEIDKFKKDLSEIGRNAREVSRYLDQLRTQKRLSEGVPINEGKGFLKVALIDETIFDILPDFYSKHADDLILSVALKYSREIEGDKVIFVSKDINLRIRADAFGIHSEDYLAEAYEVDELYTGYVSLEVTDERIGEFYKDKKLAIDQGLIANQFVVLKGLNTSALGKCDPLDSQVVIPLSEKSASNIYGIHGRNKEQRFALDLLLNDDIKLVSLLGSAGTGKTLLALAAGLYKTVEEGVYRRLLVSRPVYPMGKDLGYLPGDMDEKLRPWMQPIFDNIELLIGNMPSSKTGSGSASGSARLFVEDIQGRFDDMRAMGILEVEALSYIRGRSIPNQYMIVDEAQNLTPHEMKTIITRAGEDTKIVLTGDIYQIDNPYIDAVSNGLAYVVEKFKNHKVAGTVRLAKGERSELANLAAELL